MKRPAIVMIAAYVLIFQSLSVFMVVYPALKYGYFGAIPVIPGSKLPFSLQWLYVCVGTLPNIVIAMGLLRADRRARTAWAVFIALTFAIGVCNTGTAGLTAGMYLTSLDLVLLVLLYTGGAHRYLNGRTSAKLRFDKDDVQAIALHALAAFGTYATLSMLFSRSLPGDPTQVQSRAGDLMLMFAALIVAAYATHPAKAPLVRETALLLVSLSGFLTILCVSSQLMLQALYPAAMFASYDWKHTLPWLATLAGAGLVFLLVSYRISRITRR